MKIGELAKRSGLSIHTLRYYEKMGLLNASGRTESNYRVYSHDDLIAAQFITRCKNSGFSLKETTALLTIKDDKSNHICEEAKSITSQKIDDITQQIEQLTEMRETLKALEQFCCGGDESAEFCSIISALEKEPENDAA